MKGEITAIKQLLNEDFSVNCYELVIDVKNRPNLKLGKCEIKNV